ncbi:transposable element Tc1 transposase [Caerostris extrusa]|uniref:Transposable element Tc1 transposase n=1 Tax=Caerostris extrusa TaxID=172846 RepID=A0AAV4XVW3_CAEEX|nr:transposable element Tc1 transposase [Caerostris extrusa]
MQMTISAVLRYVTDSAGIYRVENSIGISRMQEAAHGTKYPKSTVAYVIKKWKVSGDCRHMPRVGRPTKLEDRPRRMITREIRKNRIQPMALIREEFQQASGSIVSVNTIRTEAHLHGFHGRAAAHKPLITKSNRAARMVFYKGVSLMGNEKPSLL